MWTSWWLWALVAACAAQTLRSRQRRSCGTRLSLTGEWHRAGDFSAWDKALAFSLVSASLGSYGAEGFHSWGGVASEQTGRGALWLGPSSGQGAQGRALSTLVPISQSCEPKLPPLNSTG